MSMSYDDSKDGEVVTFWPDNIPRPSYTMLREHAAPPPPPADRKRAARKWPKKTGWDFSRPGWIGFRGKPYRVSGTTWRLVKSLVEADEPLRISLIKTGIESSAEDDAVRVYISKANAWARRSFSKKAALIVNVEKGTYQLNDSFRQ